jgi:hypothetical protein
MKERGTRLQGKSIIRKYPSTLWIAMTLDSSLLRTSRQDVKRWKIPRSRENEEDVDNLIDEIISLENRRLSQLKAVYRAQARLNACRRLIDPTDDSKLYNENDILQEIEFLKTKEIPFLNNEFLNTCSLVQVAIPKLGNVIDDTEFTCNVPFPRYTTNASCDGLGLDFRDFINDPLYCLHGVQVYPDSLSHHDKGRIFLSGVASHMMHALTSYTRVYFLDLEENSKSYTGILGSLHTLHAPSDVQLDVHLAHVLMGCSAPLKQTDSSGVEQKLCMICQIKKDSDETETNPLVSCPSYIAMSMLHRDKTFYDNQLPQSFISAVTNAPTIDTKIKSSRRSHLSNKLGHSSQSIEFHVLTSSSLAVSSKIQDCIAQRIVSFYKTLLPHAQSDVTYYTHQPLHNKKPSMASDQQCESWIRTHIAPPSLLSMNEARRIVIEGYSPCKKSYIEIGHVSNYTDYISRGLQIQAGKKKDFAHIVHGTVDTAVILDFLLDNNIVGFSHGQYGILLPKVLSEYMTIVHPIRVVDDGQLFVPFVTRMVHGKNGKITLVKLLDTDDREMPSVPIKNTCQSSPDIRTQSAGILEMEPHVPKMRLLDPERYSLSKQEIEFESLSSFSFLPFYTTR